MGGVGRRAWWDSLGGKFDHDICILVGYSFSVGVHLSQCLIRVPGGRVLYQGEGGVSQWPRLGVRALALCWHGLATPTSSPVHLVWQLLGGSK